MWATKAKANLCFTNGNAYMFNKIECSVTLPQGAMDWSAMRECGISLPYSLLGTHLLLVNYEIYAEFISLNSAYKR